MKILDEDLSKSILKALGDELSCTILLLISDKPKSVMDIVKEGDIPSSSTYRRISELEEDGLIGVKQVIYTKQGKMYKMYKSTFREVTIKFHNNRISIEVIPNSDIFDKTNKLFSLLRGDES